MDSVQKIDNKQDKQNQSEENYLFCKKQIVEFLELKPYIVNKNNIGSFLLITKEELDPNYGVFLDNDIFDSWMKKNIASVFSQLISASLQEGFIKKSKIKKILMRPTYFGGTSFQEYIHSSFVYGDSRNPQGIIDLISDKELFNDQDVDKIFMEQSKYDKESTLVNSFLSSKPNAEQILSFTQTMHKRLNIFLFMQIIQSKKFIEKFDPKIIIEFIANKDFLNDENFAVLISNTIWHIFFNKQPNNKDILTFYQIIFAHFGENFFMDIPVVVPLSQNNYHNTILDNLKKDKQLMDQVLNDNFYGNKIKKSKHKLYSFLSRDILSELENN